MASLDLFGWMDAIWTKAKPEGTPPIFMMHRFLAHDRGNLDICRILGREIKDPRMTLATWQGIMPQGRGAPRGMQYVAAKKAPEEEALVSRMKEVLGESRATIERMISLVDAAGRLSDLYEEFGIEEP